MSEDAKRRDSPKVSITLSKENALFLVNTLIPANPQVKKHATDKGYSGAINMCIDAVRKAYE